MGKHQKSSAPTQETSSRPSPTTANSTGGASALRGNAFAQEQFASGTMGAAAAEEGVCSIDYVPPAAVTVTGQPDYYEDRHLDFVLRYAAFGCDMRPPDYYWNYGRRSCLSFTTKLRPRLTEDGQAWLDRTALNLQNAIEELQGADPEAFDNLERSNDNFRDFAYGTHADSYLEAGLGDLDPLDLAMIGLTPDVEILITAPGISQAVETALRILPRWGDNLDLLTPEQATAVDLWIRSGRGTIEGVTEFAYDLAAAGLEPTIELVDDTFGEGTTLRVLNEARVRAQDGVEAISEPVRMLMDEAGLQWPWEDG